MKKPVNLILFDFSGTLSLEAVEFSKPENLVPALKRSGLSALGVTSEIFFWNEIIYPTWIEGSTTARGYQAVLVDRIQALGLHTPGDSHPLPSIQKAVSLLLNQYFDQCRIDVRWRNLLEDLRDNPFTQVVISTDHYAEATSLITGRLADWQIEAKPLSAAIPGVKNPSLIANSADLGVHKADVRFWQQIRDKLAGGGHFRVLLVDDFGANEDSSDPYGDPAKVLARQEETGQVLREVFPDGVEILPFIVAVSAEIDAPDGSDKNSLYGLHISQAAACVRTFLGRGETDD
jgi:hypothetical protein